LQLTFSEILRISHGKIANPFSLSDHFTLQNISDLPHSKQSSLCFLISKSFVPLLKNANPAVLITSKEFLPILEKLHLWQSTAIVVTEKPAVAMADLSEQFALKSHSFEDFDPIAHKKDVTWIHPTAVVDKTVIIGIGVTVGPHAVIAKKTHIADHCFIGAGCYIAENCHVGEQTILFPHVVLYPNTQIGERVRIHSGAIIGADGFGYVVKIEDKKPQGHRKIYHTGKVVIGSDVEIGANTCIDRSTFGETRIDDSVKIDNLVQIGHNVHVKKGAIICGHVGIAGSSSIGEFATIAGLTGIADHLTIGDRALIGAGSLISKDVAPDSQALGNPQRERMQHFKAHARLNQLIKDEKK
jgi:UDP-3-O-[3-hydroxymyristoyl] glucosamine N-acyltransferase